MPCRFARQETKLSAPMRDGKCPVCEIARKRVDLHTVVFLFLLSAASFPISPMEIVLLFFVPLDSVRLSGSILTVLVRGRNDEPVPPVPHC